MAKVERTNMQVKVKPEVAAKIDGLAGKLHLTRQDFLEGLLEIALDDNEWIINFVTSRWVKPVVDALKVSKGRKKSGNDKVSLQGM